MESLAAAATARFGSSSSLCMRAHSDLAAATKDNVEDASFLCKAREELRKEVREELRNSSTEGMIRRDPQSCRILRSGLTVQSRSGLLTRAKNRALGTVVQVSRVPSKQLSQRADQQGAAVKVSVILPFAAVASDAVDATSAEIGTPTPHEVTERALLKSQNLLAELSKLGFGIDSDTPRNFLVSDCSHFESNGSDGDDTEEHVERRGGSKHSVDEISCQRTMSKGSEQIQLLQLASEMWSRVGADAAARAADTETSSSDGDDKGEHVERLAGSKDSVDESSCQRMMSKGSEQIHLLKLASDVRSRVGVDAKTRAAETETLSTSRGDSKASTRAADTETSSISRGDSKASTFSLPSSPEPLSARRVQTCSDAPFKPPLVVSHVAIQADDDIDRLTDLFREALKIMLHGDGANSGAAHGVHVIEHDLDVARVRALLGKVLGSAAEVDHCQTARAAPGSVDHQQPLLGRPPLTEQRLDMPLSPPTHSPRPAHPQNPCASPLLRASWGGFAQTSPRHHTGRAPRVLALQRFAPHVAHKGAWPAVHTAVQVGAAQAAAAAAVAATSAPAVAARAVALPGTAPMLTTCSSWHSPSMTVSASTTCITTVSIATSRVVVTTTDP